MFWDMMTMRLILSQNMHQSPKKYNKHNNLRYDDYEIDILSQNVHQPPKKRCNEMIIWDMMTILVTF